VHLKKWSSDEIIRLFDLHEQMGNKWKLIALKFKDRSENCVKNQWYSILKKALRQLSRIVCPQRMNFNIYQIKARVLTAFLETSLPIEGKLENNSERDCLKVRDLVKKTILEGKRTQIEERQKSPVSVAFKQLFNMKCLKKY